MDLLPTESVFIGEDDFAGHTEGSRYTRDKVEIGGRKFGCAGKKPIKLRMDHTSYSNSRSS